MWSHKKFKHSVFTTFFTKWILSVSRTNDICFMSILPKYGINYMGHDYSSFAYFFYIIKIKWWNSECATQYVQQNCTINIIGIGSENSFVRCFGSQLYTWKIQHKEKDFKYKQKLILCPCKSCECILDLIPFWNALLFLKKFNCEGNQM